jgi:hypothetical protein
MEPLASIYYPGGNINFKIFIMTKKDPSINENIDRGKENEKGSSAITGRNNNVNNDTDESGFTNVENANAAGLGAIGRNDQQQTGHTSNHSADA